MANDNEEPEAVWLKRLIDDFSEFNGWQLKVYASYASEENVEAADLGEFENGVTRTMICLGFQSAYLYARVRGFHDEAARIFVEKEVAPRIFGVRDNRSDKCADCGSHDVVEVEAVPVEELPPEAILFELKHQNGSFLDGGTIVEAVGYGRAEREDETPGADEGRYFIRAQAVEPDPENEDTQKWWYYTSRDLRPLTPAAKRWHKALETAERVIQNREMKR